MTSLLSFGMLPDKLIVVFGLLARLSYAMEVTLLDTTKTDSLGWVTYSSGDEDVGRRGWREASYTDRQGDVFRVYTVCNVDATTVDNWLRLPFIRVPSDDRRPSSSSSAASSSSLDGEPVRLYVELRFTMRRCTNYPDPGRLQRCRESIKLLAYDAADDFANAMRPTWDAAAYRTVGVVAADRVFADGGVDSSVVNVETRGVTVTRGGGVYLALRDEGACATILGVRVYYFVCDATTVELAAFPATITGAEMTSVVQVHGACVENAAMDQRPSFLCQANGNWYYRTGGCQCLPGYQSNQQRTACTACPVHTYKWSTGNDQCAPCPARSRSEHVGAAMCHCDPGHYRAAHDTPDMPCTRPPGNIENLVVTHADQTTVSMAWQAPADTGDRRSIWYRVECDRCDDSVTLYRPRQTHLNDTWVTVSGLSPGVEYTFDVSVENDVSDTSGVVRSARITASTQPAEPQVTNVHVAGVGSDYITVTWDALPTTVNNHVVTYEARCSNPVANTSSSVVTSRTNATFANLALNTKYIIVVRGKTATGWSQFSDDVYAVTGQALHYQAESPMIIIIGSVVAVVICIIFGLISILLILRRSRRAYCEKHAGDRDALHVNVACSQMLDNTAINNNLGSTAHLPLDASSVRTYVDPHTYEDPSEAVREFTREIDVSFIVIEAVIGGGEFGDVCRGRLMVPGKPEMVVAIKTLKPGASEKSNLNFLTEASIMGQFDDPNVIYLEGVVTRTSPIMIITEYMQNGSLDRFLRGNDGMFTILQLVGMLRGIASGMRYLSEIGFVHRDLAARNILVDDRLVCKVADFGLSREMEANSSSGAYTTEGGRIPVRWTAPEAIAYRKFTTASDVWSYGVVAWEVISYGEWPYWNWSNDDVISVVETGFRLPPPMECPEAIYDLMRSCWAKDRTDRPRFAAIVQTLDRLIRSPEQLHELAKPRMHDAASLCRPSPPIMNSPCSTTLPDVASVPVADWLAGIKMERYAEQLEQAGFHSAADAARLRRQDLVALGITLAGHQKKILNCAAALRVPATVRPTSASFV